MIVHETSVPSTERARWSRSARVAFRFGFSVALLSVSRLLQFIREYLYSEKIRHTLDGWIGPVGNAEFRTARYIGASALRLLVGATGTVEQITVRYSIALCYFIAVLTVATVMTVVWSALDRHRGDYDTLNRWLRVYARYTLALVMMVFATAKVVPTQFGFLTPGELLKPLGQLDRFWVLWDFMVVSTGYTIFAGLVEIAGCALLFFRRTTVLGALLLAMTLTNVIAMDIGYAVYGAATTAGLLLVLALIVIAPSADPLATIFLAGRAASLPPEPETIFSRWRYAPWIKALVLVVLVSIQVSASLVQRRTYFGVGHGVYGMFEVDRFVFRGAAVTPLASDANTWKRVASDGRYDSSSLTVLYADGNVKQYSLAEDTANRRWKLKDAGKDVATLRYQVAPDGTVTLEGQIASEPVQMSLRPVDLNSFPLLRGR